MYSDVPGKPTVHDIKSDTLTVSWLKPTSFGKQHYYQLSSKEMPDGKWKIINEEYETSTADLTDLKADTQYRFRVKVVTPSEEGPYSPESDVIKTSVSPARELVEFCIPTRTGNPNIYAIPLTELANSRNSKAKTRKMEIGIFMYICPHAIFKPLIILFLYAARK